jgi:hypothetical protein
MKHTVACSLVGVVVAVAGGSATAADIAARIESCVSSSSVEFGAVDQRWALDADDQLRVQPRWKGAIRADATRLSGVAHRAVAKARREALFITLLEHPNKPDTSCFTATFARTFCRHRRAQAQVPAPPSCRSEVRCVL